MNYLYDLPIDLQDKIFGYKEHIEQIEKNIRTIRLNIDNIFIQNTNKRFSIMIELHIRDDMIFADCQAFIYDWWGYTCHNIFNIPMMYYPTTKDGLKKLANITKTVYKEYIKNIYKNAKENFEIVTKSYYEISFPDWKKSIYYNNLCESEIIKIVKNLKTKYIYKALCITWFPNINFYETSEIFNKYENETQSYSSDSYWNKFRIEYTLSERLSEPIEEPFSFEDLQYIQECFPTIYSLLEEHGKLYSLNRKNSE
jgi:hypothetical protein